MVKEAEYKILIVDDEPDILEFLSYNLKKENYQIYTSSNGADAIKIAESEHPHLVLMDVMMPEMDGIETCERMRENPELDNTLIAFLTARGEDYSQVAGFEAGGDDYIAKPIKPRILISRIKALLKRVARSNIQKPSYEFTTRIQKGDLTIDREKFIVLKGNVEMVLPKKEFELLILLSSKPGKVFTRNEIFRLVWGDDIVVGDRTIDVHIRKLREKIGDEYIRTVKGVGYKFSE